MKKFWNIFLLPLAVLLTASCSWFRREEAQIPPERVMIFVSDGFNNLSSWLLEDIQDLKKGYVPPKNDKNILLMVAHHTVRGYEVPTPPYLIRLYKQNDVVVADTLFSLPAGSSLTEQRNLDAMLTEARDRFPVEHYGIVVSSHATGWLPSGYYARTQSSSTTWSTARRAARRSGKPFVFEETDPVYDPSLPMTKSILAEKQDNTHSIEMEIEDFADAIPMHLDYLLIDACLMGGVEIAYALRDKTDQIGFSQAEVMADGFDYLALARNLLLADTPDTKSVCSDYISFYETQSGSYHSATISLIDCTQLDRLAEVCRQLFAAHREEIAALNPADVQGFGGTKNWFYDLQDILEKAGVPEAELADLTAALDQCVLFKQHTGQYFSITDARTHPITAFCGLSMYLPSAGNEELNDFYRTLDWNHDTQLITK